MNILLSSVGRRPNLVRWFEETLKANNLEGKVIAADLDPQSPSRHFEDDLVQMHNDPSASYRDRCEEIDLVDVSELYRFVDNKRFRHLNLELQTADVNVLTEAFEGVKAEVDIRVATGLKED